MPCVWETKRHQCGKLQEKSELLEVLHNFPILVPNRGYFLASSTEQALSIKVWVPSELRCFFKILSTERAKQPKKWSERVSIQACSVLGSSQPININTWIVLHPKPNLQIQKWAHPHKMSIVDWNLHDDLAKEWLDPKYYPMHPVRYQIN